MTVVTKRNEIDHGFNTIYLQARAIIGRGITRTVFAGNVDEVVKVEKPGTFNNVREYCIWLDVQYCPEVADWLAPCIAISSDGRFLSQKRADPLPPDFVLPEYVPEFLTDLKRKNFGLIDSKLVCVDYAGLICNFSSRLRKADWK